MRVLLDTNALIWAWTEPERLPRAVRAVFNNEEDELLVSAASAWEIATKVRLGELSGAIPLERDFVSLVADAGYLLIPITADIALRAGRLAGAHRDPFDRIIAAHALAQDIPVISADAQLESFGVRRLWS